MKIIHYMLKTFENIVEILTMSEEKIMDDEMTPEQRLQYLRERGILVETSEDRKNKQLEDKVKGSSSADDVYEKITFVKVPQDELEPLQELSFQCCRNNDHRDMLMEHLKPYFGSKNNRKSIDVDLLQSQAQKNFGSSDDALSKISIESLQKVAEEGNVESFPLVHAVPSNNFTLVNIYLDEIGLLKRLPINKRAGEYAKKAGFSPPPVFYGDIFIGRVKTKPLTKNISFNLENDASPEASWLKKATAENLEYQSAMNEMTGKMNQLQPAADGEDGNAKIEQNGLYSWTQNEEEIEVCISLPKLEDEMKYNSSDIKVKFLPKNLCVNCRGINFFNLDFFSKVDPDGCTWTLDRINEKTNLVITCEKADNTSWPRISY